MNALLPSGLGLPIAIHIEIVEKLSISIGSHVLLQGEIQCDTESRLTMERENMKDGHLGSPGWHNTSLSLSRKSLSPDSISSDAATLVHRHDPTHTLTRHIICTMPLSLFLPLTCLARRLLSHCSCFTFLSLAYRQHPSLPAQLPTLPHDKQVHKQYQQ